MREKDDRPWKIPRPAGMKEHILKECQRRSYLIFNNKLGRCVCTSCDKEFSTKGLFLTHTRENEPAMERPCCPKCGREGIPKESRYGRKGIMDRGRIIWSRAYGAVTIVEMDDYIIDYQTPHPAVLYCPSEQIRLTAKEQKRWDFEHSRWYPARWYSVDHIALRAAPSVYGLSEWHDHLWVEQMQFGTDLEYMNRDPDRFDVREWFDEYWKANAFIRYMSDFLKYPAIELLEKAGFEQLVIQRARGYVSRGVNIRGKNLRKILKVGKKDLKKLRELDPRTGFMDALYKIRQIMPEAAIEEIRELEEIYGIADREKVELIKRYADIRKVFQYLRVMRGEYGRRWALHDYYDYLRAAVFLGGRIDKKVLYPNDFEVAHDTTIAEAERTREQERKAEKEKQLKEFGETNSRIAGMKEPFVQGGFLIRPAAKPQELRDESHALSHCVRTYIDKVAAGKTSILFIRQTERPDVPFFTLELSPKGVVVQCRGDHNCGYSEEVEAFIADWMTWRENKARHRRAPA